MAARSAADWARWRATTTDPSAIPPTLTVTITETMIAARTVAAPRSSLTRFSGSDGPPDNDDTRQHRRPAADSGDHIAAVLLHFDRGSRGREIPDRGDTRSVTPGGQPCCLPRGVDTADLQGDCRDAGEAEDQRCHHSGYRQGCFHRAESVIG